MERKHTVRNIFGILALLAVAIIITVAVTREVTLNYGDFMGGSDDAQGEVDQREVDSSTPVPTIRPTHRPTVTPTPLPTTTTIEVGRRGATLTGFPVSMVSNWTVGDEQRNTLPGTEFILGDPGVISTHSWEESRSNRSAIFISPDTQFSLENRTGTALLTENGYLMASSAGMTIEVNGYRIVLPASPRHEWIVVFRGLTHVRGQDRNLFVGFSNYDEGALLVTRFPVPADAGNVFSETYLRQNIDNSLQNNGGFDITSTSVLVVDLNDGAWALLNQTDSRALHLVDNNLR